MKFLSSLKPKIYNKDTALVLVILLLSALLAILPSGFETPFGRNTVRVRAKILQVDNSDIQTFGIVSAGEQWLLVEIMDGEYSGQQFESTNSLIGKMETDKMFQVGDVAFVVLDFIGNEVFSVTAYDHYRLNFELLLVIIFATLLIGFAGWSGVKALLSFVFALLLMWKILFPRILLGQDPILVSLVVVTALTAATLYLVAGVNKTAFVAFMGAMLGVLLTCGLALLLLPPFRLHGAIQPFSETLLYSGFEHLNLTRMFLAAIFIGASGAVLDVAIDVSTSMGEVVEKRPDLSTAELIKSGFTVGRNMTSTMVTTLLMAYASGYMALLMVFMAQGIPPLNLLNTNYVAAEILKTVVGSLGLVTVAPFTAIVGGFIYVHKERSYGTEKSGVFYD
ncbi:MAG: YibE/F family protein [Anaerolineae bacterium]|nr:YibE/F family protein [Anaerolineae bacterium]